MSQTNPSGEQTEDSTGKSLLNFSSSSSMPKTPTIPTKINEIPRSPVEPSKETELHPTKTLSDSPTVTDVDRKRQQETEETDSGLKVPMLSNEELPNVTNPVLEGENRLTTYINYKAPLEIIQVKDADGVILLDSLAIEKKTDGTQDSKYQLKISIPMKNTFATYTVQIEKQNAPSIQWKCVLTYDDGQGNYIIERDLQNAIGEAAVEPPKNPEISDELIINILLIGRTQVGKTTLIQSLKDPTYTSARTGISQTREPYCEILTMKSKDRPDYTLKIIDTPGLQEVRHNPSETRTDEDLLALLRRAFEINNIRYLNMIGFVSELGKTYQNDLDTFKSLIDFFDPRFKSISALILTNCDKFSEERIHILTEHLKTHPKCADIVDYCRLGIYHHGTLDVDSLSTLHGDLRDVIRKETLDRIGPMQEEMINFILSRSKYSEKVSRRDLERLSGSNSHWTKNILDWLDRQRFRCSIS